MTCDACEAGLHHHAADCLDLRGLQPHPNLTPSFVIDDIPYHFPSMFSNNVAHVRPMFELVQDGNAGSIDSAIMPCSKVTDEEHWLQRGEIVYTDGIEHADLYFMEDY